MSIPMAIPDGTSRPPLLEQVTALAAFATASALVRLAPLRLTLLLAKAAKRCARRPATRREAERLIAARDWASQFFPGRAACLEMSLAAFLGACARRGGVDWCIGCRFDPCESHAWIEAAGRPVGEPDVPDRPFHTTIQI